MTAEGETEKVYEQVFPPGKGSEARAGHPPATTKKVTPGTPLSPEEEALCEELNLENRFFL